MLCRIAALLAARANFSSFNFDLRMVNYRKEDEAEEAMRRFLAALLAARANFSSFNFDLRMVNYRKEDEVEEAMRRFLAALDRKSVV